MRFRRGARLDTGQISDRRGRSVPLGGAAIGGGGLIGLVFLLLQVLGGGGGSSLSLGGAEPATDLSAECVTGEDANQRDDCRIVGVVNSVQEYWDEALPASTGQPYRQATTVFFSQQDSTGCGFATSAVGPFYCPADEHVYIDLTFYDELRTRFGAQGGPFAEAYVIAHEYGHHVQHLLGLTEQVGSDREGPESGGVRLELQADCFAGLWAHHAVETGFIEELTSTDVAQGLDAAAAIGDDTIQERMQGEVDPDRFTHGSSEQRQRWLVRGYESGQVAACDTFSATEL